MPCEFQLCVCQYSVVSISTSFGNFSLCPLEAAIARVIWASPGGLRPGCRVPSQGLCMRREPLLIDQAPSVAVLSAVCLSTSTARNALGHWLSARFHRALTTLGISASNSGSLLLDFCAPCLDTSVLGWNKWGRSKDNRVQDFATAEDLPVVRCTEEEAGVWGSGWLRVCQTCIAASTFWWSKLALHGYIMATFICRVQFLDDTDPFNSTNFPEPTRPPVYTFREDIPLINQLAGVHRLLKAPHKVMQYIINLSSRFLRTFL